MPDSRPRSSHIGNSLKAMALGTLLALGACATLPDPSERTLPPPEIEHADEPSPTIEELPAIGHEEVVPDPPPVAGIGDAPDPGSETAVIQFADAWLELAGEARSQQYQDAEANYRKSGAFDDLVRLGLLTALRTDDRATATRVRTDLRGRLETEDQHALAPFGRVVLRMLDERERAIGRLASQNDTLQRQLDELKAIEEQLRDRGRPELIPPAQERN